MSETSSTTRRTVDHEPSAWEYFTTVRTNPLNLKCQTLPILSLSSQYSRNLHLSWLGFWVAFLSWFAFAPLIPEAVKKDLQLTPTQIGNSNIVSLSSTLIVRLIAGPLVDRYGPRKVMAVLLVLGAIPSGLAATVKSVEGLYAVRFFIGILGGTFVPCQAWSTTFYDKNVVGFANAIVGGWGNSGAGITFIIMTSLYNRLLIDGLSSRVAWRAAFAIVPVPILLITAILVFYCGTDHPAGKWEDRHNMPAAHIPSVPHGQEGPANLEGDDEKLRRAHQWDKEHAEAVNSNDSSAVAALPVEKDAEVPVSSLDTAVNEPITLRTAGLVLCNPLTWLPSLAYLSNFGFEIAIDANLGHILLNLYKSETFTFVSAGYYASIFGLMNILARPIGGYVGDRVYRRYGVPGKKWLTIVFGVLQGAISIGLGVYLEAQSHPSLGVMVALSTIMAIFCEAAGGVTFALVPHCNPNSNGLMSGIVGASGNVGGIIFAMIFRFAHTPISRSFWISGIVAIVVNAAISLIRVPAW